MPVLVIGQWQRVVNAAMEPSPLVPEPSWQLVGESLRSSGDLISFCLLSSGGPILFSAEKCRKSVTGRKMVFRIHRTDRQWELPE